MNVVPPTNSLGATWVCCPPEFGTRAVIDRLAQVEPTVLIAVDGYRYRANDIDRTEQVSAARRRSAGSGMFAERSPASIRALNCSNTVR